MIPLAKLKYHMMNKPEYRIGMKMRKRLSLIVFILTFFSLPQLYSQKKATRANDFMEFVGISGVRPASFSEEQWPVAKERLEELQVRYMRSWIFDDAQNVNQQYELYHDLGIKFDLIHPTLGTSPTEGITAIKSLYPTFDMIAGIESINEPFGMSSGGTINDYRNHLIQLYNLVNSDEQLKDIPVIGIATAHPEEYKELGDLSAYCDFGNIHPYPTVNLPPSGGRLETWLNDANYTYGGKQIWSTESGYHTNTDQGGTPDHIQAKYLPRLLLYHFLEPRITKTFYFTLRDHEPLPNDGKWWGICLNDSDLTPKPAFTAWKNMSAILNDFDADFETGSLDYTISGKTEDVYEVLLQKGDGSYYLILWNEVNLWNNNSEINPDPVQVEINFNEEVKGINIFIPAPEPTGHGLKVVRSLANPSSLSLDVLDQITIVEIHKDGQLEGIDISNCPENAIHVPETFSFEAILSPENPVFKKIYWSVSDNSVAEIDSLGNLYSLASGFVKVKAYSFDSLFVDSCTFEVIKTDVDSVVIPDTVFFTAGETYRVDAQVYPANASFPQISWKSLNTDIVKVNQEGYLQGFADGIAYVVATSTDSDKTDTSVVVTEFIETTDLRFERDTFFIPLQELITAEDPKVQSFFPYGFSPANASDKNILAESQDETIIGFDSDASIINVNEGMTEIVIHSADGNITDTAFIVLNSQYSFIEVPVTGDSVLTADQDKGLNAYDDDISTSFSNLGDPDKSWIQLYLAEETDISEINIHFFRGDVRTYPFEIMIDSQLAYSGSSELSSGFWSVPLVKKYTGDTITIIGTGLNSEGNFWFKLNEINMIGLPEFIFTRGIKITDCIEGILRGDTTLHAEIIPANSTDKRMEWYSGNPSILNVSPFSGKISPAGVGEVDLGVRSFFFTEISDECNIEVSNLPEEPQEFNLLSPATDSIITNSEVMFRWEHSGNAGYYEIYIDNNEDFSSPEVALFNILTDSILIDIASLEDNLYFWKIIAQNESGSKESNTRETFNLRLTTLILNSLAENIRIYPVPVSDQRINIELRNDEQIEMLEIISMQGEKVYTGSKLSGSFSIDLTGISSGIYLMRIINDRGIYSRKLIMQ